MSWTEEKVNKLKELWGKGQTASQIAEIIGGISRNAVIGKAHRLNLSAKIKTRSSVSQNKEYFKSNNEVTILGTGSDIENNTPALGELSLEFAPGAMISNLTLEVAVNGSDGYWINQPQLNILNPQTNILDWRGQGDFGRQNDFLDYDSTVTGGVLDSSLKPNTISDASWQIPTGIEITDLIIEALRPVDPKLSLTSKSVLIHDSEINPFDGRLYLLVDDDLLHIDDNSAKKIIDIHQDIYGRSIQSDSMRDILYIGQNDGNVTAMRLSDSSIITDFPIDVKENSSNSTVSYTHLTLPTKA